MFTLFSFRNAYHSTLQFSLGKRTAPFSYLIRDESRSGVEKNILRSETTVSIGDDLFAEITSKYVGKCR